MLAKSFRTESVLSGEEEAIQLAVRSFANAECQKIPYQYWLFESVLPLDYCEEIVSLPVAPPEEHDTLGKRDSRNDLRRFFSPEMQDEYAVMGKIARVFGSQEVVKAIETLCGVSLNGSYLRIEYCQDRNGFWLEPHMDIKEKLVTIQIYLNQGEGAEALGTDIYNKDKSHFGRAPSTMNQGMLFVPREPDSFHGFEKRPIRDIRRSLIVNFVTDDWRARHELAFPNKKVAF